MHTGIGGGSETGTPLNSYKFIKIRIVDFHRQRTAMLTYFQATENIIFCVTQCYI